MSLGSSLGAFAQSFAGARQGRKDREERDATNARQDRWLDIMEKNPGLVMGSGAFGVGGGAPAAGVGPMGSMPPATGGQSAAGGGGFPASLIQSESGGNWRAQNGEMGAGGKAGHYGRLQFGHARLQDAMNAGVIPQGTTPEAFMADPGLQARTEAWHFSDIDKQAQRRGLDRYIGQNVGGAVITQDAIRSMAHLGGIGGATKYLNSGGKHNPKDSFGTSLGDYARRHGGTITMGARPPAY